MTRLRTPWWLYVAAASFCGYLALNMYLEFRGPEMLGISPVFSKGRMVLLEVSSGSPGARAGLKAGDRVLAVEGQPIQSRRDWVGVRGNFELGSPDGGKSNAETKDFRS